jgi:hypothetical protein
MERSSQANSTMFLDMSSKIGDLRKRRPSRFCIFGHFQIEREILHKIHRCDLRNFTLSVTKNNHKLKILKF